MIRYLLFGTVFGVILSRVGATQFDAIAGMFLLEDLHLAGVIGVAAVVAGAALRFIHHQRSKSQPNTAHVLQPKPRKPGNVVGGLLFGAGWALTGTCPGTGLAQLGEGQIIAVFTVAGMFAGTALYRRWGAVVEGWLVKLAVPWRPSTAQADSAAITTTPPPAS